jgi:hypothetical protein
LLHRPLPFPPLLNPERNLNSPTQLGENWGTLFTQRPGCARSLLAANEEPRQGFSPWRGNVTVNRNGVSDEEDKRGRQGCPTGRQG